MDAEQTELNKRTDARTNQRYTLLDHPIQNAADLESLRTRWAKMDVIPKLLASRTEGVDASFGDLDVRILLSGEESSGRLAFVSIVLPAGAGIPAHGFDDVDTLTFVMNGPIEVTSGALTESLPSDGFSFAPNRTTQALVNRSNTPAEVIVCYSPAGAERAFIAASQAKRDPDGDNTAYWKIFAAHGFQFTQDKALPRDARTNAPTPRVDASIESLADYENLREKWRTLEATPKLVSRPRDCHMIPATEIGPWLLLSPEEARAAASAFLNGVPKGVSVGPHHQPSEDEFFIVAKGPFRLSVGDEVETKLERGAFGFAPRFCTHSFGNDGDSDTYFFSANTPGGHDRGFEVGIRERDNLERLLPLMQAHGFIFHGEETLVSE